MIDFVLNFLKIVSHFCAKLKKIVRAKIKRGEEKSVERISKILTGESIEKEADSIE